MADITKRIQQGGQQTGQNALVGPTQPKIIIPRASNKKNTTQPYEKPSKTAKNTTERPQQKSTTPCVEIKNVRLDFNIEANGGIHKEMDKAEAFTILKNTFETAVLMNETVKAKIFHNGGPLAEGEEIWIKIRKEDCERLANACYNFAAPECDITQNSDGSYDVVLSEGPSSRF